MGGKGGEGLLPFFEVHDGWAFVFEDGFVRVHADVELVAELAGLHYGAGMAWVG